MTIRFSRGRPRRRIGLDLTLLAIASGVVFTAVHAISAFMRSRKTQG
jgi:hypothetical protein